MSKPVYVIGLGLLTSLGSNVADCWRLIRKGASGIRRIDRFDASCLPAQIAATVHLEGVRTCGHRSKRMLAKVCEEAWSSSGVPADVQAGARIYLAAPTPDNSWAELRQQRARPDPDGMRSLYYDDEFIESFGEAAATVSSSRFCPVIINTACASGATAIQLGVESLRRGASEVVLAGAADSSVFEECIAKFCLIGALSTNNADPVGACRPFSASRGGFVMGECAAAMILATEDFVLANDLDPIARISGLGDTTDDFHRTRSSPDGGPMIRAMSQAIADAGLAPSSISHINAHGTGTPENDKMESLGIRSVFGKRSAEIPLAANKSLVGHSLTAAGLVEAVIATLSIRDQVVPPTLNTEDLDTSLEVAPLAACTSHRISNVLSNSFGFGGQNVSLVLSEV